MKDITIRLEHVDTAAHAGKDCNFRTKAKDEALEESLALGNHNLILHRSGL